MFFVSLRTLGCFIILLVICHNFVTAERGYKPKNGAKPLGLRSGSLKRFSKTQVDNSAIGKNTKNNKFSKGKALGVNGETRIGPVRTDYLGRVACGEYNSGLFYDRCGVCGGNNDCVDCHNVTWGKGVMDKCDKCDGTNECLGCDLVPWSGKVEDICGVCDGDGKSCLGCDRVANSGKVWDACGKCGGDNSSCCGISGNCNGHGICYEGQCNCFVGYTGGLCTRKTNMCLFADGKDPCSGHGVCNPDVGSCACNAPWFGDKCEMKFCSGNGWYDPKLSACKCWPGYSGDDCSMCASPSPGRAYICVQKYPTDDLKGRAIYIPNGGNDKQMEDQMYMNNAIEWGATLPEGVKNAKDLSKEALESIMQPILDSRNKKAVRFIRIETDAQKVASHLIGVSVLSRAIKGLVILPGMTINGTTYGCDCSPSTPHDEEETYVIVDSESHSDNAEMAKKVSKESLEDKATRRLWGKKDPKESKTEESKDTKQYNSLTIVKQKKTEAEEKAPSFGQQQLSEYGFYTPEMSVIATGKIHSRFVNVRTPITGDEAKTYLQNLLNFFDEKVNTLVDDATVIGNAVDAVENRENINRYVSASIIIFALVSIAVLVMLGTMAVFIIIKNSEAKEDTE